MSAAPNNASDNAYAANGSHLDVDRVYWDEVMARDRISLCNWTFFEPVDDDCLQFCFLNETVRIDLLRGCLLRPIEGAWTTSPDPLLTLATVMYLKNVQAVYPLGKDIVGIKELKEGHFFVGPHALRTGPLMKKFANDIESFIRAGEILNGQPMEMADAAFQLLPYPRVALYFLLWAGDAEFEPRIQVLFDRPIEKHLAADAIWALVNRVAEAIYLA